MRTPMKMLWIVNHRHEKYFSDGRSVRTQHDFTIILFKKRKQNNKKSYIRIYANNYSLREAGGITLGRACRRSANNRARKRDGFAPFGIDCDKYLMSALIWFSVITYPDHTTFRLPNMAAARKTTVQFEMIISRKQNKLYVPVDRQFRIYNIQLSWSWRSCFSKRSLRAPNHDWLRNYVAYWLSHANIFACGCSIARNRLLKSEE